MCTLISDLTQRYGPVVRQARVVGVLDAAFDVLVPDFGIEKRVHVDQMPIDVGRFVTKAICYQKANPESLEPRLRRTRACPPDLLV